MHQLQQIPGTSGRQLMSKLEIIAVKRLGGLEALYSYC